MSKHDRKQTKPNIAPAALLRVRLEGIWLRPGAEQTPAAQLAADLTAAARGLKPETVVEVALSVFQAARPATQAQLVTFMPSWLASQNYAGTLERLIQSGRLAEPLQLLGTQWLGALGREAAVVKMSGAEAFYKAWEIDDGSQASVIVLWYSNPHKNRARGLQFLIDYNPPWEGAVKDAFLLENKPPEWLEQRYIAMWAARGQEMTAIDAVAAKRKLLGALRQNQAAQVRLPQDLVPLRQQFIEHVLSLPDAPDTPAFTVEDFHTLSETGQSAEELARFEQTVARRIRMPDGQELYIDASLANDDFDDWDDEAD